MDGPPGAEQRLPWMPITALYFSGKKEGNASLLACISEFPMPETQRQSQEKWFSLQLIHLSSHRRTFIWKRLIHFGSEAGVREVTFRALATPDQYCLEMLNSSDRWMSQPSDCLESHFLKSLLIEQAPEWSIHQGAISTLSMEGLEGNFHRAQISHLSWH